MAARKSYIGPPPVRPELDRLLDLARRVPVTDAQLQEQRVSFAFGNAPEDSKITKDTVRLATLTARMTS